MAWNATGDFCALKMAVNLSSVQIARGGLLERTQAILAQTGLPPEQLEFEVTEGVMVTSARESFKTLAGLRALGVAVAIDDFGTGYSSLAVLKQLPITRLKIDRSFVINLPDNKGDLAIAQMIQRMAETLELQVTAEGVETEAQAACLRDMGCNELQGYYFSRPQTAQALEAFWRTRPQ